MTTARTYAVQTSTALLLVIASLWAATQWAAAMLAYQPALGRAPRSILGVLKLYAPWQLFTWWLAFDAQAPDVFARAGAVAALGGIASGLVAIGGAARRAGRRSHPTTYGSARWADSSDVSKAGLLRDAAASSSASTATATCATTAPSMCWRWRRPAPARASAWCCPRC